MEFLYTLLKLCEVHQVMVESSYKVPVRQSFDAFYFITLKNLLCRQSSYWWSGMSQHSCYFTLMYDSDYKEVPCQHDFIQNKLLADTA